MIDFSILLEAYFDCRRHHRSIQHDRPKQQRKHRKPPHNLRPPGHTMPGRVCQCHKKSARPCRKTLRICKTILPLRMTFIQNRCKSAASAALWRCSPAFPAPSACAALPWICWTATPRSGRAGQGCAATFCSKAASPPSQRPPRTGSLPPRF